MKERKGRREGKKKEREWKKKKRESDEGRTRGRGEEGEGKNEKRKWKQSIHFPSAIPLLAFLPAFGLSFKNSLELTPDRIVYS